MQSTASVPAAATKKATSTPSVKLVDYFAEWCGPCQAMKPFMHEIETELAGKVTFEMVDVDKESDRANAAGVMSIPTLHIEKDGKIIQTMIGFQSKDDLTKALNAALGA